MQSHFPLSVFTCTREKNTKPTKKTHNTALGFLTPKHTLNQKFGESLKLNFTSYQPLEFTGIIWYQSGFFFFFKLMASQSVLL